MDRFQPQFGFPVGNWFKSFAFLPTHTIDQGWKWLSIVYKRRIQKHDYIYGGQEFWWQCVATPPTAESEE